METIMECAAPILRSQPDDADECRRGWRLETSWARCEDDVRAAQQLRYRVFVQEMGARPVTSATSHECAEADRYDAYCDHLLVRAFAPGIDDAGIVVGTYRVLGPDAAARAGGLYSDTEFDLAPLARLRARAVELGRSCVDPGWRSGAVIMALWTALGIYMFDHGLETMIGCASISIRHGRQDAQRLWQRLRDDYLVAPEWRVRPLTPLPLEEETDQADARMATAPPLIKGYLRCGARLLGPPAFDPAFNTADLPMMLRVAELSPRYRRHFMGR
jgi:putative hemolysin